MSSQNSGTKSKEEIALELTTSLLKADGNEVDRVLRLYSLCAALVDNPPATEEEGAKDIASDEDS